MSSNLRHFELDLYQLAYDGALLIFESSEAFPAKDGSKVVDRLRRSSRAVYSNIAEAWDHRLYEAAFTNGLVNAEAKAAETQTLLEIAAERGYFQESRGRHLIQLYERIIDDLDGMIEDPDPWLLP